MARGHVVAQIRDTKWNVMDKVHANLILDTELYQVEFY